MDPFIASVLPYLAILGGVIWVIHKLATHPLKTCPRCKGARNIQAGMFGRYKRCGRCGGSGEVRGWLGGKG